MQRRHGGNGDHLGSRAGAGGPERPADARGPALAACSAPRYAAVVKIRHKGLPALHERDDHARLPAGQVSRLRRILFRLQEAKQPADAAAPGFRLHPLKVDRAGQWSVRVTGNWRVVFRFEDNEAVDVDLIDYH